MKNMRLFENISERKLQSGFNKFIRQAPRKYLSSVSVDTVIFRFHESQLQVLIFKFGDTKYSMLPGGYIGRREDLDEAAHRILKERTGLDDIYLEQFYTAGKFNRSGDPRFKRIMRRSGIILQSDNWFHQRFISVCYYALIGGEQVIYATEPHNYHYSWCDMQSVPDLLYDHNQIIEKALERLQNDIDQKLIGLNLLKEPFTMKELQGLYESIFKRKFTRTNFQRKMLNLGILVRLEKKRTGEPHRSPYLYKFSREKNK
jgi:ADP-ribose pyrophosphatase YjhB (NUDIX family)